MQLTVAMDSAGMKYHIVYEEGNKRMNFIIISIRLIRLAGSSKIS